MQKARRHPTKGLRPLAGARFQGLFCAIGLSVVFSLTGWSPQIPAEFLVLRGTQVPPDGPLSISRTGLSPSVVTLSCVFRYESLSVLPAVLQPRALP